MEIESIAGNEKQGIDRSLRRFWYDNPEPAQLTGDVEIWLIKQCWRISELLQKVHERDRRLATRLYYAGNNRYFVEPDTIISLASKQALRDPDKPLVSEPGFSNPELPDFDLVSIPNAQIGGGAVGWLTNRSYTYRPPEVDIENALFSESADVWSLGCVFLEFVTWYVLGVAGLREFVEDQLATKKHSLPILNLSEDFIVKDTFFSIRGRGSSNAFAIQSPAITKLIAKIRGHSRSTRTIRAFLDLIDLGMLEISKEKRVAASLVAKNIGYLLVELFDRPTTSTNFILGDPSHEGDLIPDQEQLRLILYDPHHPSSAFDRLRIWLETRIGLGPVDWYPLRTVDRLQHATNSKLTWRYNHQELSIILNEDETNRCRDFLPVTVAGKTSLPIKETTASRRKPQSKGISSNSQGNSQSQQPARIFRSPRSRPLLEGKGKGPEPAGRHLSRVPILGQALNQECYFCVDKASLTKKETYLSPPIEMTGLADDAAFFRLLNSRLKSSSGRLIFSFAPWMAYNAVNLCQFSFMDDNSDLVAAFDLEKFPREESLICAGYLLDSTSNSSFGALPLDIYMRKIGRTILAGLEHPDLGWNRRNVLNALPKRWVPPKLPRTYHTTGWGFHVHFGVSFLSVAFWVVGLVLLGLAFVPIWLALVDKRDLQNAFTPASTLFSIAAMLLAGAALIQNK
ncbi:hypothetical protein F5Y08DRAFT_337730 [Xylaria arbuscula]|nr:hypothetical protein F5Y08DRAFT_337730 [Xylaria arbuscula]